MNSPRKYQQNNQKLSLVAALICRMFLWWCDSPQAIWSQTHGAPGGIFSWRTDTCYHMDQWGWEPCLYTLAHKLSTGRTGRKWRQKIPRWTCCSMYVLCFYQSWHTVKSDWKASLKGQKWDWCCKCFQSLLEWELIYRVKREKQRGVNKDSMLKPKVSFIWTDNSGVVRVNQSSSVIWVHSFVGSDPVKLKQT